MSRKIVLAVGLLWALAGGGASADGGYAFEPGFRVNIMTRNLYTGTDLFRLLEADVSRPIQALWMVGDRVLDVVRTNFPERAEALAAEIQNSNPDLVGLQEAALIRVQVPGDYLFGTLEPAQTVLYDFLALLQNALVARGLAYEAAVVLENTDIELPGLVDLEGLGILLFDVRLTDRDVILVRSGIGVSNVTARHYANVAGFTLDGAHISLPRGFEAIDATVGGRTYRFVNTHLEVEELDGGGIQGLQAQELIDELAWETLPVILVGDFNSAPADPLPRPYPALSEAGYTDLWQLRRGPVEPGFTCCQAAELTNEDSTLSERIDHVFVRNDLGELPFSVIGQVEADVTGDSPEDRTPSGLWPSDHAGAAAAADIPLLTRIE
jgi:endonuclease/exonuclease/phosphatase family metal-dependent hydrolase